MNMENNIVRKLIKNNINPFGFILTSPGSGRVHCVVQNIMQVREECPNDKIIVVDANGDYSKFIDKCGGKNIVLSSGSVFEKNENLHYTPTLEDLYNVMKERNTDDNSIEKRVITVIENIISDELNILGSITNIDVANLMSFDISSFPLECRDAAMICVIEYVWSQVLKLPISENRTWIFIDNINLLFCKDKNVQEDILEYLNYLFKSREESAVFIGVTNELNTLSNQDYINNSLFKNSELLILKKEG